MTFAFLDLVPFVRFLEVDSIVVARFEYDRDLDSYLEQRQHDYTHSVKICFPNFLSPV